MRVCLRSISEGICLCVGIKRSSWVVWLYVHSLGFLSAFYHSRYCWVNTFGVSFVAQLVLMT